MPPRKRTVTKERRGKIKKERTPVALIDVAGSPCKVQKVSPGYFRAHAADMPISMKLCDDQSGTIAKNCDFNSVIIENEDGTVVSGQPTNLTKTKFTINLSAGKYIISIVLDHTTDARFGYVYEDCDGSNKILSINFAVQPSGDFDLEVI